MDKVKEKAPASGGAEVSAKQHIFNESITLIDGNVKRVSENSRELIVDNFAGGGGASTGIELATGRPAIIPGKLIRERSRSRGAETRYRRLSRRRL